jgi:phage tail-like protein
MNTSQFNSAPLNGTQSAGAAPYSTSASLLLSVGGETVSTAARVAVLVSDSYQNRARLDVQVAQGWFAENLPTLVPEIYADENAEDWAVILGLFGLALDNVKGRVDGMIQAFGIDRAPRENVVLLGRQVGIEIDPTQSIERQRDRIAQAVHEYRRKGTYRDIYAALDRMGAQATVVETRTQCLRLNQSGQLGAARLAGRVYNAGVLLFTVDGGVPGGFCTEIRRNTPAGIRIFARSA